jgi:endo-1,4-beta-xylanase
MRKILALALSLVLLPVISSCAYTSLSAVQPVSAPTTNALPLPAVISIPEATASRPEAATKPSVEATPTASAQPISIPPDIQKIQYLRTLAESRGLMIGTAVAAGPLRTDPNYADTLSREFNILTPENAMKFAQTQPGRNTYNFADADTIVAFAEQHNIKIHGHTLVWHNSLPTWLTSQNWSRDELISILKDHIMTVVGRYRGKILAWDVVNEAITDNGALRDDFWLKGIGPDYIEMAFRWAHEADPNALLLYNDYGCEAKGKKSDAVFSLVQGLIQRGVPINGIGLQMHVCSDTCPATQDVKANIDRLASLGVEVYITEMDIRLQSPVTAEKLARQASIYSDMLNICLTAKNCKAFMMWGFTDKFSWIPSSYPGFGSGLIFDESYQPKPAYSAMNNLLCNR